MTFANGTRQTIHILASLNLKFAAEMAFWLITPEVMQNIAKHPMMHLIFGLKDELCGC